jgi:hypothetical protein
MCICVYQNRTILIAGLFVEVSICRQISGMAGDFNKYVTEEISTSFSMCSEIYVNNL